MCTWAVRDGTRSGPRPGGDAVERPAQKAPQALRYWLASVSGEGAKSPRRVTKDLVLRHHVFAMRNVVHSRTNVESGDRICFYVTGSVGVIADARVASEPHPEDDPRITYGGMFPMVIDLNEVCSHSAPIVVDFGLRERLDEFAGRSANPPWSWFVRTMHTVSQHDFNLLIGAPEA